MYEFDQFEVSGCGRLSIDIIIFDKWIVLSDWSILVEYSLKRVHCVLKLFSL